MQLALLLTAVFFLSLVSGQLHCDDATTQCEAKAACKWSLADYAKHCVVDDAMTMECSSECNASFTMLQATEGGQSVLNCTCSSTDNSTCNATVRSHAIIAAWCESKSGNVTGSTTDRQAMCESAQASCSVNKTCQKTYRTFSFECVWAKIRGEPSDCSLKCNESHNQLSQTSLGRQLIDCFLCDRHDRKSTCEEHRANFEVACLGMAFYEVEFSSCDGAESYCWGRDACRSNNFDLQDRDCVTAAITGSSTDCTSSCNLAYELFNKSLLGRQLINCSLCGDSSICDQRKNNFAAACLGSDIDDPTDNNAAVCRDAQLACGSTESCRSALISFVGSCIKAITAANQSNCNEDCRDSYAKLSKTEIGLQIINCTLCSDPFLCRLQTANFEMSCFGRHIDDIWDSYYDSQSCFDASMLCGSVTQCGLALRSFIQHCLPAIIAGNPANCSDSCWTGFLQLNATRLGRQLINCTLCANPHVCQTQTENFALSCLGINIINLPAPQTCMEAVTRCGSTTLCSGPYYSFLSDCTKAASSGQTSDCTSTCKASHAELISTPIGRHMANCTLCGGNLACESEATNKFAQACSSDGAILDVAIGKQVFLFLSAFCVLLL